MQALCRCGWQVEGLTDSQLGNNTFLLSAQRQVVGCELLSPAPCFFVLSLRELTSKVSSTRFDLLDFEPGVPRVAKATSFSEAVAQARSGKLPVWIRTVPAVFIYALSPRHRAPPLQQVLSLVSNSRVGKWIHALGAAVTP